MAQSFTDTKRDFLNSVTQEIERLEALRSQIQTLLDEEAPSRARGAKRNSTAKSGGRRRLSPEARERIATAQRKRWAKSKSAAKKTAKKAPAKKAAAKKIPAKKTAKKAVKKSPIKQAAAEA